MAAIIWLKVVWMRPASSAMGMRESTMLLSLATSRHRRMWLQDGVAVLLQEGREGLGVGGVAGLGALGLGQVQLVEQDLLDLLGRAEVELAADGGVGQLLLFLDLAAQGRRQARQVVGVDGDARAFHGGQDADQRQLDLVQEAGGAALFEVLVEDVGEFGDGARADGEGFGGLFLPGAVQGQLAGVLGFAAQLAVQVAQGEVGEVERALAGEREVGGERGVAGDALQPHAARGERQHRALGLVDRLGAGGVGEVGGEGALVVLDQLDRVEVDGGALRGRQRQRGDLAGAAAPGAGDGDADPLGGVGVEPGAERAGFERLHLDVEALLGLGLGRRDRGVEPFAQDPELQRVEQGVDLVAVPLAHRQLRRRQLQADLAVELVDLVVAQHAGQVLAQVVAGLALDLADPVHEGVEVAVLGEPLGGGLRADAGHAGQVVAALPHEGGELAVALGRDAVLGLDGGRVHPGQLRHAADGVKDRHRVVDQLERVAVAGDDEGLHPGAGGLDGQRGDDVVRLEPGDRQPRDAQRVQHLEDQADLAAELVGRLLPARLVLHVLLVPERRLGAVERHRDVGRLLVAQDVDEHRGEAVHGVGRLPVGRGEVLHGQREERPVGQGMAVEQKKPVALVRGRW
ncbi:hypothetical protein GCM10010177_08460 [Actinomadura citrea]|nr:hypothetical protein GCM10010177_08460 [Actinomadura citrea]